MQAPHTSLGKGAFGEGTASLITVKYQSYHAALTFLTGALQQPNGLGLLYGPLGAGKTTVLRELSEQLSRESAVAFVDGRRLKPRKLLTAILAQFGVEAHAQADDELLQMIRAFATQLTRSFEPPILIIDNVDRTYPSTLRIVNDLASLNVQGRSALRFIMAGHETLNTLVASDGMKNVAERDPSLYSMGPLSAKETMIYLHARLQAAGSERADTVFPFDVCDRLREKSGGWPGLLNLFALEAIERATDWPVSVADTEPPEETDAQAADDIPLLDARDAVYPIPPRIIVTRNGKALADYTFADKKVLIGRSDFADIVIDDDFVSKIHAVLLLYADALVLLDLNSANGTTVNSVAVKKTILKEDDIISLGHHRLKVRNAPAISAAMAELLKSPDTLKMKNLVDLRRQRARQLTKAAKNSSA
ncbi:MAG: FHA domain-containing protein [Gammaproteobacteria bacterium]|nr:FHA domain-containing protein [Gammaproteobacteria bacterium]